MHEVVIGIDIGTSYIKGVATSVEGELLISYRKLSSQINTYSENNFILAAGWWLDIKDVFHNLLKEKKFDKSAIKAICVSGIAPTITLFDAANPDNAYSILYSTLTDIEKSNFMSQCDPQLTKNRIELFAKFSKSNNLALPCITDLVGYINWRLTNKLTINSISLFESGMKRAKDCELFAIKSNLFPLLVAVNEQIGVTQKKSASELGIQPGIPVCGGCTDTLSSVVGSGLTCSEDKMLYLGTFGSYMVLKNDVDSLLDSREIDAPPFEWLLSVPKLGPTIELLSTKWFGPNNLHLLDQAASKVIPGANGLVFLLPRWKNGMVSVGEYEFIPNQNGTKDNIPNRSRAVLEGIAYAITIIAGNQEKEFFAGGGGARSKIWIDSISTILGVNIHVHNMSWEATGSADIAARMINKTNKEKRSCYTSFPQYDTSAEIIKNNCNRLKEYYNERNWI